MHLTKIPIVLAIALSANIFFIFLGIVGIRCFARMPPEKFGKLGWCLGCLGRFVRIFSYLVKFFHYAIMVIIMI